jgi:hypothetical protein
MSAVKKTYTFELTLVLAFLLAVGMGMYFGPCIMM